MMIDWPPSREEVQFWLKNLEMSVLAMQFMSAVQLVKMFEDAQEHGKQRSRGRVNMDQINKTRKVPDEQLQDWVKIANRLRVEKDWSNWKASGYIAQTQVDKGWRQRTIYNHLLKYKNLTSRVS